MKSKATNVDCILSVLAVSLLLVACNKPESDLKKAEQANTEQAYNDFIKQHFDSPLAQKAKSELEALEFAQASRTAAIPTWETFIQRYPQSTNGPRAHEELARLVFHKVATTNTISAYEDFTKRFSDTEAAKDALKRIVALDYQAATNAEDIAAYQGFISKHPDSELIGDVRTRIERRLEVRDWNKTLLDNSADAYLAFSSAHPNSTRIRVVTTISNQTSKTTESAKENLIATQGPGPTEPVWVDDERVAYKIIGAIHWAPKVYVPSSVFYANYDLMALKEIDAGDPKFENYGMLSQDKKCVVSTTVSATWTVGENETKNPKSHIIVIEKASKHVKLDFSFAGEVQGAALSPDNHAVVFGNQGQIWWLDVGNSNAQILIKFRENARFPQFSPDGKNVYFIQDTSSGTVFFVLDLASKSIVQAFKGLNPVSAFSLSPDGKSIVFASTNEVRPQSEYVGCIWLLDIETGKVKRLTDRGTDQYPSFSPNGRWISFQRQQGLYLDSDLKAFNVVVMPYEPDTK